MLCRCCHLLFFFTDPATTEIYTLSLHALFRSKRTRAMWGHSFAVLLDLPDLHVIAQVCRRWRHASKFARGQFRDRKSTRLNSSHSQISYAVFCLKKKN